MVDPVDIEGRNMLLPGEILEWIRFLFAKKSAEVIVAMRNEP
jgi:predicted RNA-binding protein associated with RNAse of E/G family